MKKNLQELALFLGGIIIGQNDVEITGVNNIDEAGQYDITFAVSPNIEKASKSNAGAVIIPKNIKKFIKPAICVDNPKAAFVKLLELFYSPNAIERVTHSTAIIGNNTIIGKNVAIMAYVVIDNNTIIGNNTLIYPHTYIGQDCKIGSDCLIYSNVSIRENTSIGKHVIINSGAVLGNDGFGFITSEGKHSKVPQVGNVIVEDNVEIGANATIDRATVGSTIIKQGSKIDNLVHLAHNVVIGENCLLAAQTGIAGSTKIGNNNTFAGQSGSVGHITTGDNCIFAARTAVINNVANNSFYAGLPARPHNEWLKIEAAANKLPELLKKVRELEKRVYNTDEN